MRHRIWMAGITFFAGTFLLTGCGGKAQANIGSGEPPKAQVEHEQDGALPLDHPEYFPIVTVGEHVAAPDLKVTGTVSPDVSRNIPVISLASGRVVEIGARIGDTVAKGQLLMQVQSSDISQ